MAGPDSPSSDRGYGGGAGLDLEAQKRKNEAAGKGYVTDAVAAQQAGARAVTGDTEKWNQAHPGQTGTPEEIAAWNSGATAPAPAAPEPAPPPPSPAAGPETNWFGKPQLDPMGRGRIPGGDVMQQEGRDAQMQGINLLYQGALGEGPSQAQGLLQGQQEKALRQQQAQGALGGAAGLRSAGVAQAGIQGQMAQQMGTLAAREQMSYQQRLTPAIEGLRSADIKQTGVMADILNKGAVEDRVRSGQLADVYLGTGQQELEATGQVTAAEVAGVTAELQASHQNIVNTYNYNQNELELLRMKIATLTPETEEGFFQGLLNAGQAGMGTYLRMFGV